MSDVLRQQDVKHYRYGAVLTPFQQQEQEWDRPLGSLCQKTATWRVTFFWMVLACIVLFCILLLLIMSPSSRVIAVQMTPKGFVTRVGVLPYQFEPGVDIYKQFAAQYVGQFYRIGHPTVDSIIPYASAPEVVKGYKDWQDTHSAAHDVILIDHVEQHAPGVFQVSWTKGSRSIGDSMLTKGQQKKTTIWVSRQLPATEAAIMRNPLGFYVVKVTTE